MDVDMESIPCSAIARDAGDDRLVSVAALGGLIARRPIVEVASIRAALAKLAGEHRPELIAANLGAFARGLEAAAGAQPQPAR